MREKILYASWGCLYILCVGLGTIEEPAGFGKAVLVAISLLFFVPGALLLADAVKTGDKKGLLRLRVICLCSLVLTLIFLVASILSVNASAQVGTVLTELLMLVSAPMFCGQYWFLSLFLWSCLLIGSFPRLWLGKRPH